MPELPEVETTRRGIAPHLLGHMIKNITIRDARLRWPVNRRQVRQACGQQITRVRRRSKYLLIDTGAGTLILHLGMSGSLRVLAQDTPPGPHDHIDFVLDNQQVLRLRDPRRFGSLFWTRGDPSQHPRLRELGPEPLSDAFTAEYLLGACRRRKQAIKSVIMDSHIVVGVGNIYACEALFQARIHPRTAAGRIALPRMQRLVDAILDVLTRAIEQGGTTLRDFTNSEGKPGYFVQSLQVYGREGEPCHACGRPIRRLVQGQRSSFYCPGCQH